MTDPVRFGVLGASSFIAQGSVLPALARSESCELTALASRSGEVPDEFGAKRVLDSYEALLADPEVEAVYVPLPNTLHLEWATACARAGKHVLCEKPLAPSAEEAREIAAACEREGVLLAEAYVTPNHPRSEAIAELLAAGRLGRPQFGRAVFTYPLDVFEDGERNWRRGTDLAGGALLDLGIYCLAPLLEAAGGPPLRVAAASEAGEEGAESGIGGWLAFEGGFSAGFYCSFDAPRCQRLEIHGSEAIVRVEQAFLPGPADTELTVEWRDGRTELVRTEGINAYQRMAERFAAAVRGERAPIRSAAASIELLEVVERCALSALAHDGELDETEEGR